jgi:uncharacterized membrane protein YGL010W
MFKLPSPPPLLLPLGLPGILLVLTGWGTANYFSWTMMAVVTFSLAYFSKGWRSQKFRTYKTYKNKKPSVMPDISGGGRKDHIPTQ